MCFISVRVKGDLSLTLSRSLVVPSQATGSLAVFSLSLTLSDEGPALGEDVKIDVEIVEI